MPTKEITAEAGGKLLRCTHCGHDRFRGRGAWVLIWKDNALASSPGRSQAWNDTELLTHQPGALAGRRLLGKDGRGRCGTIPRPAKWRIRIDNFCMREGLG
jgi:hypothetical protein